MLIRCIYNKYNTAHNRYASMSTNRPAHAGKWMHELGCQVGAPVPVPPDPHLRSPNLDPTAYTETACSPRWHDSRRPSCLDWGRSEGVPLCLDPMKLINEWLVPKAWVVSLFLCLLLFYWFFVCRLAGAYCRQKLTEFSRRRVFRCSSLLFSLIVLWKGS